MGNRFIRNGVLITNIALSIVIPIILAVLTSLSVQISILLTLAALILTMQIEDYLKDERKQQTEDFQAKFLDSLSRNKDFGPQLTLIADDISAILGNRLPRAYVKIAKGEFDKTSRVVQGLRRQAIELNGVVDSLRDSDSVSSSYKAVSMLDVELAWWHSTDGQDWLAANSRWLNKGHAKIERIFIYEEPWNVEKETIVQQHIAEGVHVKKVSRVAIPSRLRINVGIFDESVTMEFFGWGNPDRIERVIYSVAEERVKKAISDFAELNIRAEACSAQNKIQGRGFKTRKRKLLPGD